MSIYACSDLHGRLDLYHAINNWLKEDDKVIFAGDAIDRGPFCLATSLAILENPQWVYLKGNHEDLMLKAFDNKDFSLWFYNGGDKTFYDIKEKWGEPTAFYLSEIRRLPTWYYHESPQGDSIVVCHAGFTPDHMPSEHELLWDRDHLLESWPTESKFHHDIGASAEKTFIVHGHTPVQSLFETNVIPEVFWYNARHQADIDLGSMWSDRAALLNLDTLNGNYCVPDVHYFTPQGEVKNA